MHEKGMDAVHGFYACPRKECNTKYSGTMLKNRMLVVPINDPVTGELTGFWLTYIGETTPEQEHYFTLFKTARIVQRVFMNDGSCANLGNEAMLKAIEQINASSTEQMMKFLPFEIHGASTWQQLEWNQWVDL